MPHSEGEDASYEDAKKIIKRHKSEQYAETSSIKTSTKDDIKSDVYSKWDSPVEKLDKSRKYNANGSKKEESDVNRKETNKRNKTKEKHPSRDDDNVRDRSKEGDRTDEETNPDKFKERSKVARRGNWKEDEDKDRDRDREHKDRNRNSPDNSRRYKDKDFPRRFDRNFNKNNFRPSRSMNNRFNNRGQKQNYSDNYRGRNRSRSRDRSPRDRNDNRWKRNRDRSRSRSFDHGNARWGRGNQDDEQKDKSKQTEKEKPNFGLSGKLTEERNTYRGVVIKYSEPPEARKPKRRWRLYPFKGEKAMQTLYIHRESAYLIGRDRKIVDLPVDHPSCSKQHAVLQYRLVPFTREDGTAGKRVRPYLIDLESANGTFINNKKIEPKKYVELLEKDVIKFGYSTREYVLLHENSKDEMLDDDVKQEDIKEDIKQENDE